jgi:hypothetical protein
MENSRDFRADQEPLLNAIGGESLVGSGFEAEQPDEGFDAEEPAGKAGE